MTKFAKHRRRVRKALDRTRRRLRKLFKQEHRRDAITAKRKKIYLQRREELGDENPRTKRALKRFRASRRLSIHIDETEEVLRKRGEKQLEFLHRHPPPVDPDGDGLMVVDGVFLSVGIGMELLRIRSFGVWKGKAFSGFRTPEHSEEICIAKCGAPTCSGTCAGRSSRHSKKGGRDGAVDLSDFITFAEECERRDSWLENHLPSDLPHFSDIGN